MIILKFKLNENQISTGIIRSNWIEMKCNWVEIPFFILSIFKGQVKNKMESFQRENFL